MQGKTLALVGAGRWGKNLARNYHALGALHTICDANEALLDTYTAQYPDVALTSNYTAMLDNPLIKQVVIATSSFSHHALAKQALLAQKDVYVEKPLCVDVAQAEELVHLARKLGRILMVGHLLQYHPCVKRLQELVGSGELGKIHYIVSNRLNLGSIRIEENALWSFAPHDISVILSICGQRLPDQVRCVGADYLSAGVADVSLTTMRFSGGVRAHIYVNWLNPFKEQKLVVVGSNGLAVFDDTKPWGEKLLIYRNHITWTHGHLPSANSSEAEKVQVPQEEPLREECLHFLKCCEERLSPRTDGEEALRVMKVLQAAQASLNEDGEAKCPSDYHSIGEQKSPYFVHPTAIVDSGCEIGEGTKIWHFSHVMENSKIGPSCSLGQNVVVSPGCILGSNVKVQNNVSIYSGVICEDDVFLGPSMVFTNVINPRSQVVRRGEYQETMVRKGVSIGANATIVCGIELGEYCFIGAGAVVTKDIKPFALVVGNPGRQIGWMSRYGERLSLPVAISSGERLTASCAATGELYLLSGDQLTIIEEKSLTPAARRYKEALV